VTATKNPARNAAMVRLRAAYETYVLARDAQLASGIEASERVVEATTAAYKAGKGDLQRVLLARRELALAKGRRLDMVALGWRAYAALAVSKAGVP